MFCWTLQVAQGFGLLLGTIFMDAKTAQTIASIVVLAFTLVGGYFVRGAPQRAMPLAADTLQINTLYIRQHCLSKNAV